MGRPKKDKPLTSKERVKTYRSDPAKRFKENKRKRDARKSNPNPSSEEELLLKRENDRKRKAESRKNRSRQKIVGTRAKDRNRKQKTAEISEDVADSTKRVRKHHQQLKVAFNFPTRSKKRKVVHVAESINTSLSVLTPKSKVKALSQTCSKGLSPASSSTLSDAIGESNPLVDVYTSVKRKRDTGSNCVRRLILNKLSAKSGSGNQVRRSNRSLSWTS